MLALILFPVFTVFASNSSSLMIVGHRGVSGPAPEHTLEAFELAIETYKVHAVEFDIRACKDDLVIMNSTDLSATTNGTGLVKDTELADIKKLSAGPHGEKVPTLNEALACIGKRAQIILEIKEHETVERIAAIIKAYCTQNNWELSNVYASSLHHPSLIAFQKLCPGVKLLPCLIGTLPKYAKFAEKMSAWGICTTPDSITQEYVDDAHARGLKILAAEATLNHPTHAYAVAQQMIAMGVDGLVLNNPGIVQ